jgi:hypothetical protein
MVRVRDLSKYQRIKYTMDMIRLLLVRTMTKIRKEIKLRMMIKIINQEKDFL